MILLDVDVLVYAFRADMDQHEAARAWLRGHARQCALTDRTATSFLRLSTDKRVFAEPAPIVQALEFIDRVAEVAAWINPGRVTWTAFSQLLVGDASLTARMIPDAYLAAICLSNGASLATSDRGFGRFPGLQLVDPLQASC